MPIIVQCSGCGGKFRGPDELAGKQVKCPKCSVTFAVPIVAKQSAPMQTHNATKPSSQQSPSEVREWFAMSANGQQYGPFTKGELDRWVRSREFNPPQCIRRVVSQQWELADRLYPTLTVARNKTSVDISKSNSIVGLFNDFLSLPSLRLWELDAIEACRIGTKIRDDIMFIMLLVTLFFMFFIPGVFLRARPGYQLEPIIKYIVLPWALIAIPSFIAYFRCTVWSVVLTALVSLPMLLGIVPVIIGIILLLIPISLFRRVGQIQSIQKRFPLTFKFWHRTKKSLDKIKKHHPPEWLDWTNSIKKFRKTSFRLRFFENVALIIFWEVGGLGQKLARARVIDRVEANYCRLSSVSSDEHELTGFAASADIAMKSIPMTNHIAKLWKEWCAGSGSGNSSA